MCIFASIEARLVRITGWPKSGWRAADDDDPSAREMPFRFAVTDDGGGHFLLVYHSLDGVYCADTWHESLADAFATAKEQFGIERDEWSRPRPD
jgi:hypothetical protein